MGGSDIVESHQAANAARAATDDCDDDAVTASLGTTLGQQQPQQQQPLLDLQALLAGLAALAHAVQKLPSDADEQAYESSFPEFQSALTLAHAQLLELLQQTMATTSSDDATKDDDVDEDGDMSRLLWNDLSDPLLWEHCADLCDTLVEQVEAYLAVSSSSSSGGTSGGSGGQTDGPNATTNLLRNWRDQVRNTTYDSAWDRIVAATDMSMAKPQETYQFGPPPPYVTSRTAPFIPTLHPQQPFLSTPIGSIHDLLVPGHGYDTRMGSLRGSSKMVSSEQHDWIAPSQHCPHLYEKEIQSFSYTPLQLQAKEPAEVSSDDLQQQALSFTWIDTEPSLAELSMTLETVSELAMDLEAHSYRSFAGMVCLMQISIRNTTNSKSDGGDSDSDMQNYLIDCLALRHCLNQHLASVLANPAIVKVLHGADSDIQWLQRDFGLYIVNMFDTGRAARQLSFESAGYAYVLKRYTGIVADKSLQLADWRQRPLSPAMQQYAVQDTHYLLHIYDCLKYDLAQENGEASIAAVLDTSRQVCLIRYCPEPFDRNGYRKVMLMRNRGSKRLELNVAQEAVLKALWDWRDATARSSDESVAFVCTNANLLRMAMSTATGGGGGGSGTAATNVTVARLQGLFNPVPPLLLQHAQALTEIIKEAATQSETTSRGVDGAVGHIEVDTSGDVTAAMAVSTSLASTFFKPKNVELEHTNRGIMSPVLGTEALYQHAGWMTPIDLGKITVMRKADVAVGEPVSTTDGDGDGGGGTGGSKPKKLLQVHSSNQNYRSTQHTENSLDLGQQGTVDNRARGRSVDGMGSVHAVMGSKSPNRNRAGTSDDDLNKAREKAARIQDDIKVQQDSIPTVLGLVAIKGSEDDDDDEDVGLGGSNVSKGQQDDGTAADEVEFPIPRSIREIYMISNRNRRNKKAGSPSPEHGITPTSEKELEELAKAEALLEERSDTVVGYFDDSASPGKRHKKSGRESEESIPEAPANVTTKDDDLAFMKEIGWIQSKEDLDSILNQRFGRTRGGPGTEEGGADEGETGRNSVEGAATNMGVIHPSIQHQPGSNPFFTGAAASMGGPLTQNAQQQHQRGGLKKPSAANPTGNASTASNNRGKPNNRSRQPERPERKDNRTHAYRKR